MGGRHTADGEESERGANRSPRWGESAAATRRRFLRSTVGAGLLAGGLSAAGGAGLASATEVLDATLTVESESTANVADEASASLSRGVVVVEGSIAVPNPCYSLELGDVRFDGNRGIVVPVVAGRDASMPGPCPQVVTAYDYRVEVVVTTVPETVTVGHDAIETWETDLDVGPANASLAPQNFRLTDRTSTSLSFAWEEPLAEIGFERYEVTVSWTDVGVVTTTEATSITLHDSIENLRMSPDTEYTVSVRPLLPDQQRPSFTPELRVSTLPADDPTPVRPFPRRLSVEATTATSATLHWSMPVPDDPDWKWTLDHLEVSVDGVFDHRPSGTHPLDATVTGLTPETTYEFAVVGVAGDGTRSEPTTATATTDARGALPPVGDAEARPTDPDGDGLYEDVNGNGEGDLADAVDLFQHRESAAVANETDAYDFSGNDEIDMADVVDLFQENVG